MTHDSIHRPAHYAEGRIYEPIAVIEDWDLNYRLGNTVKYISRAGRKQNALEDLKKARWYLDREIDRLELAAEPPTDYEQVLTFYGQTQDDPIAWPEPDGSGFDVLLETDGWGAAEYVPFDATKDCVSFDTTDHDWSDFWAGWDESAGPTEVWLSDSEIENVLAKKDLNHFDKDEIVSIIDKRGLTLGVKKDGSTCLLKDGRCT
jgi:hypothetical protein